MDDDENICPAAFLKLAKAEDTVLDTLRKYLTPDQSDKEMFGEVFTPLELVCDMLSKLPKSVWTNKHLKWLDPANGIGNFPVIVYYKLMSTLSSVIKNKDERSKHIIENMLFMVELNPINVALCKKVFKMLDYKATPNIIKGSFLDKSIVLPKHIDIIIGNPPYNPPKKDGLSSGNSIWQNFVIKSFYILDKNGYLLFIHPPGWKKPTLDEFKPVRFRDNDYTKQVRQGQIWQVLKNNGRFLYIYSNDQRVKTSKHFIPHFPAVDYYVYEKNSIRPTCDVHIIWLGQEIKQKKVKLNYQLNYLPNIITNETQDILNKITSHDGIKANFISGFDKRGFKTKESGKYKYFYETKKGGIPVYTYSAESHKNIDMDKVIMNQFGGIDGYYIQFFKSSDHIGVQHHAMYNPVKTIKEGKQIEKFFKSDIVRFIFLITQYAFGQRTMNEPLVSNSLTIPEDSDDYYKYFDIDMYKSYINELLTIYHKFSDPKTREDKKETQGIRNSKHRLTNLKTKSKRESIPVKRKSKRTKYITTSKSKRELKSREKFRRSMRKKI
jgi:hypothetical protein